MDKGNKDSQPQKQKLAKRETIFFFFAGTYLAVDANEFSPFWIYKQRDKLKLDFQLTEKKLNLFCHVKYSS